MSKIVVAGGGWAGAAAALRACKCGADVTLLERTDLLLGVGNVGGIMRNNGRFTAAEENIALGAGELFEITDRFSVHKNVDFPGHKHASFYDAVLVEPEVRRLLQDSGIEIRFMTAASDVIRDGAGRIEAVETAKGEKIEGDAFIETTGTTGPMGNCMRYGNGCSMCILRCPSFGPRISLTEKAGADDVFALRKDGSRGAFSGSCKIDKQSLSTELRQELESKGFVVVPLPERLINRSKLTKKVCQQYALDEFAENLILIDAGCAKLMTSYFNLEELRSVPGFENARFADPYAGGKGNSVRYMSVGVRDNYMRAVGFENFFLGGEKSGFFIGHTEAITTGSVAGYNAAMAAEGRPLLELPRSLAVGELIAFANEIMLCDDFAERRFTFAGGEYFERMKEKGLYITEPEAVAEIVKSEGLWNVYNR